MIHWGFPRMCSLARDFHEESVLYTGLMNANSTMYDVPYLAKPDDFGKLLSTEHRLPLITQRDNRTSRSHR